MHVVEKCHGRGEWSWGVRAVHGCNDHRDGVVGDGCDIGRIIVAFCDDNCVVVNVVQARSLVWRLVEIVLEMDARFVRRPLEAGSAGSINNNPGICQIKGGDSKCPVSRSS
jgi:hypothetical protein